VGATPAEGESGDRGLVGVLGRIREPSAVAKTGLLLGFSRVNATGPKVGLDESTSIKIRLTKLLDVPPEPPIYKTVITAAEATIATAAKVTLVAIDMHFLSVAAVAIVPAPVAADAPVTIAA
jgi:hypothetical protein